MNYKSSFKLYRPGFAHENSTPYLPDRFQVFQTSHWGSPGSFRTPVDRTSSFLTDNIIHFQMCANCCKLFKFVLIVNSALLIYFAQKSNILLTFLTSFKNSKPPTGAQLGHYGVSG